MPPQIPHLPPSNKPQPPATHLLPPLTRTIAHYERIDQIGEGTYGQVYKARCLDHVNRGTLVAMKKIRPLTVSRDKDSKSNKEDMYSGLPLTAIREIKILKELRHENMVRLLEVVTSKGVEELDDDDYYLNQCGGGGSSDEEDSQKGNYKTQLKHLSLVGNLFLVLEYVPMDLTGLMDMSFRFTEVQAKCVFRQLLDVLAYIHENKYVHRDIKCSNILLDWNFHLKLADFGLARSIRYEPMYANSNAAPSPNGSSSSGSSSSGPPDYTNKVITLWYRPPELLLGTTNYGAGVDMWSAGCILAELILGRPILPGKSEMEQLRLIFELIGSPDAPQNMWNVDALPLVKSRKMEVAKRKSGNLRKRFPDKKIPKSAMDLIEKLLTLDPRKRMSAKGALTSRYFIQEPRAPENPADLGKIELEGKTEKDNFHEFQTKKIRKEAKVIADAAKKDALKKGLSKSKIDESYHEVYKNHMLTAKRENTAPKNKDRKRESEKKKQPNKRNHNDTDGVKDRKSNNDEDIRRGVEMKVEHANDPNNTKANSSNSKESRLKQENPQKSKSSQKHSDRRNNGQDRKTSNKDKGSKRKREKDRHRQGRSKRRSESLDRYKNRSSSRDRKNLRGPQSDNRYLGNKDENEQNQSSHRGSRSQENRDRRSRSKTPASIDRKDKRYGRNGSPNRPDRRDRRRSISPAPQREIYPDDRGRAIPPLPERRGDRRPSFDEQDRWVGNRDYDRRPPFDERDRRGSDFRPPEFRGDRPFYNRSPENFDRPNYEDREMDRYRPHPPIHNREDWRNADERRNRDRRKRDVPPADERGRPRERYDRGRRDHRR